MKKSLLLSFIFVFALVVQVLAQNRTVTGKVTDQETGQGLPGVTVLVKGTSTGTATGIDGGFSIAVPSNDAVLEFRYVGYDNKEVVVGSQSTINILLGQASETLSEVVIVGYSTTTQQSFTGTAKVVSAEKLENKQVSNVSQALAGEVAGVRIINTSGQPGQAATVRIRGLGSVNGNRDPLYVVDGVPFSGNIASINPSDIESTTVLKDAAATAIYGSRGANGVIVVTTKSGRGKKNYIEADANFGTNAALLPRYDNIKSPEQFAGLTWESLYNYGAFAGGYNDAQATAYANGRLFNTSGGINPRFNMWNGTAAEIIDPATRTVKPGVTRKYSPENWEDYGFQNSNRSEVNVKFGGSSGKTSYYSSVGYLNDVGYIVNSDYERLSARLNVNQEINKWLNGAFNINYARSSSNQNGQSSDSGSIFWFVDNIPSIFPLFLRDGEGNFVTDPIFGGNQYDYGVGRGFGALTNSIADATYDVNRQDRDELNGNISMNFNILEGLTLENRLGAQYYNDRFVNRGNKYYGSSASQNGSIWHRRMDLFSYNLLNMLRYNKSFGEHSFEALVAHEATDWKQSTMTASGYNLVDPDIEDLNNAVVKNPSTGFTNQYSLESYFGQVNYDLAKKYFVSGTIRRDGSSRFRKDKWGTFGSVGLGWLISSEDFMANQSIFNSLKLKASYGLMGDQAGVGLYPGYDVFNIDNLNDNPAFSFDTKGNMDLTWETSKMFQTGIDFELNKYVSGSIDYYVKNTTDLIFQRRVGPSLGYALTQVNDGNLQNRGLEFDLTGDVFEGKDYRLSLNVNGEIFTNEITEMPLDFTTGERKPLDVQGNYAWAKGRSIYDFYMREWAGVDPADGKGMWNVTYNDLNGNGALDAGEGIQSLSQYLAENPNVKEGDLKTTTTKTYANATQKFNGKSAIPDVRGAFNLSAGYKGFDISAQMLYSFGGYAYDGAYASLMHNGLPGSNNWHQDIMDRWQKPGDVTDVPRLDRDLTKNFNSASTRFITKANYMVLNNVRLSYTLPTNFVSKYGVGGMSVWVSGDNLWIHTAREGFNPSTAEAGASSTYRYSPLSNFTAGIRVKI
ncbi:SusC/RagA family TonB-linked outer membrane protein [Pontibacter sp. BT310]|uniref:SusC/RagA family TonB-linked outer membrane protein n=1 Tax=Pontibacter populi TaxID=890055 RepID=A0ABS6XAK9_9BACT|nr:MULTISPECIES: SusC/RagA family TonB-linked outer membrane protein [Pontibacter]MBJ6117293.1 SusC/RagA family TonB-linked outer membrane protein [Pontibacter sp. BT310]MBR0569718.1 SusC/RagA family TonB-linked outer membrane protein [Microvirga sp. STS03]MBW3364146.1 SusC/RagA family TonB-linked outer membrane protein [Pontibacter populi]